MFWVGAQVAGRSEMHLIGEIPKVPTPRPNPSELQLTYARHGESCQILLSRILELHHGGLTAEEIALRVLTTEPENAPFRGAMLVEIILDFARRRTKERNQ
jgi:hypothetical protein